MRKKLTVCLFVWFFFGFIVNLKAQEDKTAIQRLLYFYQLKDLLSDKVWPSFGSPKYDVDLAYYTSNNTYLIDHSGIITQKKSSVDIYKKGGLKIKKVARLDTIGFHMSTAYESQDSHSLWYHNPVMLCSDYENTQKYVKDVGNLQTWATMVMHEYFHGFQFLHPAFIRFANDSIVISNTKLQSYYDRYPWYRESIDKENQLLLDCLQTDDLITIKILFKKYTTQRDGRVKRFSEIEKFDLSVQEEFLEKMEGSARYMEYQLYLLFKDLPLDKPLSLNDKAYEPGAFKAFTIKDKPWLYESSSIRYFYSTGFNLLRLLDHLHVDYKKNLFDTSITPYRLLTKYLDK